MERTRRWTVAAASPATPRKRISKRNPSVSTTGLGKVAERLIESLGGVRRRDGSGNVRKALASPFLEALFRLPNELHLHILRELCVADILSLRQTSRLLNDLITSNAPLLVRHWVQSRLGDLHLRLYPMPSRTAADFGFLLAMRRRHIASIRLTRQLADHLVGDPLDSTCPRQRQLWTSVYERMMPLVFGVGFFLDEHRRLLLERDLGRIRPRSHIGYNVCTTGSITEQEMAIMKKLDAPLRLQYFYMYCFIVQVLMRKLRPPRRTGPVEKFLRGWLSQPACPEDVAFFVVLGGIGQIAKLLARPSYGERRRYSAMRFRFHTMSPHTSKCWRRHWRRHWSGVPRIIG
ncbi:hypothetical protein SNOG_14560 [Parastagonospora nodorum SN15]|uniref:F-box domain-containing protein n=1 Tax=Phaeosphaeria nodorum (strain SN15 / ATCC MYA-4574 / FGSC 10173) TaxID=321614 RepID=Q0U145_PHANO|nr:hypothetical protein SNOG_14560 [Parastagonospora nodorum SN15]EAT78100.1 hypothetical protein SNOG_14560 [Parastagonospora nodorum SN15]